MTELLRLAHGPWLAELRPDVGGAIARLAWNGANVLRPAPPGTTDPVEMACFPLVPYANRIAHGRFHFAGQKHELPRNFGTHPHSIHGVGWTSSWKVVEQFTDAACLAHAHRASPDWPWSFRARQQIHLAPNTLTIILSATNCSDGSMPAGLGLHPCFPLTNRTRLAASATAVLLADETSLPTLFAAANHFADWAEGAYVAGVSPIDHAHDGWDGVARIEQPEYHLLLTSEGARAFHLYCPAREGSFCFEPVSHLPDAVNRPTFKMDVLRPGESSTLTMRLTVTESKPSAPGAS